jgi:hypothetical protein
MQLLAFSSQPDEHSLIPTFAVMFVQLGALLRRIEVRLS